MQRTPASPTLRFLGAAGTVTGSKYLIDTGDARILIDCGLFQGPRRLRELNWSALPVDAREIDAVLLTHAHLDHVGYLPVLWRNGFRGRVFATPATKSLAQIVLADSGRLQEEEADYANGHGYSKHHPAKPLYTEEDALEASTLLNPVALRERVEVARGVTATWHPAGHILGSATITVELAHGRTVQSSGDLGRRRHPLLRPPDPPQGVDTLLVESTYGDRRHEDENSSLASLAETITSTLRHRGVVVIPAFAVDRTEVILYRIGQLIEAGRIPQVPIHVDSPMSSAVLSVYRRAMANHDSELRLDELPVDPFSAAGELHESHTVEESRALKDVSSAIIIASSGMATGGRVLHHLTGRLPDRRNAVILVGYQSPGTRGQRLASGTPVVKIFGRYIEVKARIVEIQGFSVHADADELIAWQASAPRPPEMTYVVHGEPESSAVLRDRVRNELSRLAVVPNPHEVVRLD